MSGKDRRSESEEGGSLCTLHVLLHHILPLLLPLPSLLLLLSPHLPLEVTSSSFFSRVLCEDEKKINQTQLTERGELRHPWAKQRNESGGPDGLYSYFILTSCSSVLFPPYLLVLGGLLGSIMVVPGEDHKVNHERASFLLGYASCIDHVTAALRGHQSTQQPYWVDGAGRHRRAGKTTRSAQLQLMKRARLSLLFQIHSRSFCSFRTRIFSSRGRGIKPNLKQPRNVKISQTLPGVCYEW